MSVPVVGERRNRVRKCRSKGSKKVAMTLSFVTLCMALAFLPLHNIAVIYNTTTLHYLNFAAH